MLRSSLGLTLTVVLSVTACAGRTSTPAVPATAIPFAAALAPVAPQLPQTPAAAAVAQASVPGTREAVAEAPNAHAQAFAQERSDPAPELLNSSTFTAPIASPQTTATVSQDLRMTVHDIDIPLNAKVLSYVQLFTGRLKGYLEEGLSRGARFLPMIQAVFRAEGLPLDLAYVPLIESAFKPTAVSRAKARGIWQFMSGTALENGLATDWYIDERSDPEKATYAAARYLKTLHGMFDDWHLALAAYNGGPGRLQRAMRSSGRDDLWKLIASSRYLPRETREYVPLILAAVIVAKNPAQYGLTIAPPPTPAYEEVLVASPVDLLKVAEWAGVDVETIQQLNPELRRWTTPVRADEYALKVPEGTAALVEAGVQAAPAEELASFDHHTVKKGETIASIAKKLKVTRADLAEANYLTTRARLEAGQRLIIPRAPSPPDAVLASHSAPVTVEPDDATVVHRVKRGETLISIARLYQTTVTALKEWNRIQGNLIQTGQRLTILAPRTVATN